MWASAQNVETLSIVTDFVNSTHTYSTRLAATGVGATGGAVTCGTNTVAAAGTRISFYIYITALPAVTTSIWHADSIYIDGVQLRITSAGVLQLWNRTTAQIGTDGSTLATGQWYRISYCFTLASTSVNEHRLYLDSVLDISISDATLTYITATTCRWENPGINSLLDYRLSDVYIDNDSSLADPGNILIAAKRPVANGSLNEFTTQIGSGNSGYGTGHSNEVNERPLSTTNGWSISTTTRKTEEFTLEASNAGDLDLTAAYINIVDYMGWISAVIDSASNSPVHRMILNGATQNITLSTNNTVYRKFAGSSTYPTVLDAIGLDAQYTTTPHLTSLFECGVMVAYVLILLPTVTTQAVSSVGATTATGNGDITVTGGENADQRGMVYSTTTHGDPGNVAPASSSYSGLVEETGSFSAGAFTESITGLISRTVYYARAYSHNLAGYSYGSEISFTTIGFTNPANIYSSDDTYATLAATSGILTVEVSKDAGANWQTPKTITFTGADSLQTCGTGAAELWGSSFTRADLVDATFRVRLSQGNISQVYKTFGFTTGSDILTGMEVNIEGKYASSTLSLDLLEVKIYYGSSILPVQAGSQAFASNGRKAGEGAGSGTGVLVYYDGSEWIASDTGATVAA